MLSLTDAPASNPSAAGPLDSPPPELLERIAREHLGIETLNVRNRDCLDFHDVGVSGLAAALTAAYAAGAAARAKATALTPEQARACLKASLLKLGVVVPPSQSEVALLVAASEGKLR